MAIQVNWDNDEQTIILYAFNGKWSWDDLFKALDKVESMAATVPHTVDAIIDLSSADLIPSGMIFSFDGNRQAKKLASRAERSRGEIVIAGANGFIRSIYDAFRAFDKKTAGGVHFTDTLDEARAYLALRQSVRREISA